MLEAYLKFVKKLWNTKTWLKWIIFITYPKGRIEEMQFIN